MDDDEILARALDGDRWAYQRLGERIDRELRAFLSRRFRSEIAQPHIQEAALRLLDNLHLAPRKSRAFSGWLLGFARNQANRGFVSRERERRRAHLRDQNVNMFEFGRCFDEAQFGAGEHCQLMVKMIEKLPAKLCDVMLLRLEGATCSETAERLEISESTVMRREKVARRRLEAQWSRIRLTRTSFRTPSKRL